MRFRSVLLGITVALVATMAVVGLGPVNTAVANPTPGIAPDFVLNPNEDPKYFEIQNLMVANQRNEPPDTCRNNVALTISCDVMRMKLNRSTAPGAQNFVILELNWDHYEPPTLVVGIAGLSLASFPNMDLLVYRTPSIALAASTVGGISTGSPERVAFIAEQDEYDVVIKMATGMTQSYNLRAYMSDELFEKPFESLDEAFQRADEVMPPKAADPYEPPPFDFSGGADNPIAELAPLPTANLRTDRQIRGLGSGINQLLGSNAIDLSRGQRRDVVAVGTKPSGISLVLALLVLPTAAAAGGAYWLRRRRQALI